MPDYADLYDGYWQRPDRVGESSFEDADELVVPFLAQLGGGRVLDLGCGMGALVRAFLRRGVDAYGVDVSSVAAAHCHGYAPHRFLTASALALPFADNTFDTVISTDCLEHLAPADVPRALAEMRRVSRRNVFLRVAIGPDRDGHWHLTIEPRPWWENAAFEIGLRKHPAYYRFNRYTRLEYDGYAVDIVLEKIPDPVFAAYPMDKLRAERDLHMDMLRETGRRSDAHVHRYQAAADLVRPGDVVLDAACGLGYGSHLLATMSPAGRVLGLDLDDQVVAYAKANFGDGQRLDFRTTDVQSLAFLDDRSVDLVVSFETLEHIPEPTTFLAEVARVLKPGGRIIASVPNNWADASGQDPNPWHLHVYDWDTLRGQFETHFKLERAYGETAGGGMRLNRHPRDFFSFSPRQGPPRDSEWLLAQGMVDPLLGRGQAYAEQMYGPDEQPPHLIAFARDYANPYLAHAMVSLPWRIAEPDLLTELTDAVAAAYPPDSADYAAAACVEAYRVLDDDGADAATVRAQIARLDAIAARPSATPHYFRWQVSTAYVGALLACRIGDLDAALERFQRCADYDCRDFSPTLATKTIGAAAQAAMLRLQRGDVAGARRDLERGIDIYFGLFDVPRTDWLGHADRPFDFPYFEMTEIAAAVTTCVNLLRQVDGAGGAVPAALPVENLQAVTKRLQRENAQLRAALADASRPLHSWPWHIARKVYRATIKPWMARLER